MYAYSQIAQGVDQGSSYEDVFNVAEKQGIDNQADSWQGNFDFTTQPTLAERSNASHWVLSGHSALPLDRYDIEQALANGNPVAIGLPVTMSFEYNDIGTYPDDNGQDDTLSLGNHAVTAIGYDPSGLEIENSCGTRWGKGGFVRLSWAWLAANIEEANAVHALKHLPINTGGPTVSGTTLAGRTLTAGTRSWNFGYDDGTTYSYQWQRSNASTWTNVGGATRQSYLLMSGDLGHSLRVVVTATSSGGGGAAVSPPSTVITGPAAPPTPRITRHPSASTRQRWATFAVVDRAPNATFQCKLDKGPWRACRSVLVYRKLCFVTHMWSVQAVLGQDVSKLVGRGGGVRPGRVWRLQDG